MEFQSNLAMMEDTEVEEKINIEDLVLPSEPTELAEIYFNDIKQEPLEEENQHATSESDHDVAKKFKVPSEPTKSAKIDFNDIKQEPFDEEKQQAAFESYSDGEKKFKLKMEENILELYITGSRYVAITLEKLFLDSDDRLCFQKNRQI